MKFSRDGLAILDQRVLPHQEKWMNLRDLESVALAIEQMSVRGAPAIAAAALFGLTLEARAQLSDKPQSTWATFKETCFRAMDRLLRTRPTAVNLFNVIRDLKETLNKLNDKTSILEVKDYLEAFAQKYFEGDLARNKMIGDLGASYLFKHFLKTLAERSALSLNLQTKNAPKFISVMTHCNTGALATGGYGTALGIVRSLYNHGQLGLLYVNETRPWLQGARLTAFEMHKEGIPFKVAVDSAAATAMKNQLVHAVVVGADRIAANGDTANKIGTYQLSIAAAYHRLPFYVAASWDTIDFTMSSGDHIIIEERHPDEIRVFGGHPTTPRDVDVWNPSFDLTPQNLISGIITERGVALPPFSQSLSAMKDGALRI